MGGDGVASEIWAPSNHVVESPPPHTVLLWTCDMSRKQTFECYLLLQHNLSYPNTIRYELYVYTAGDFGI